MNDGLLIVFTWFAVIDLTLVGTTCVAVILLVRKVMLGKVEIKIADKKIRLDRDFIMTGNTQTGNPEENNKFLDSDRKYVSE